MTLNSFLDITRSFVATISTKIFRYYEDRIPQNASVLVVSNHCSFIDAPVLMEALSSSIRFACHHYIGQLPIMREIVTRLDCFTLESPENCHYSFFQHFQKLLHSKQMLGVFPEGTKQMLKFTPPNQMGEFQRGFANLALRSQVEDLAILPIAIAYEEEVSTSTLLLRVLSLFDRSELLSNQPGLHPLVIYRRKAPANWSSLLDYAATQGKIPGQIKQKSCSRIDRRLSWQNC